MLHRSAFLSQEEQPSPCITLYGLMSRLEREKQFMKQQNVVNKKKSARQELRCYMLSKALARGKSMAVAAFLHANLMHDSC